MPLNIISLTLNSVAEKYKEKIASNDLIKLQKLNGLLIFCTVYPLQIDYPSSHLFLVINTADI